ncbi:MAG: dihydrofolate synthase/folylpolyglutamate synthase [Thiomicrorhabdus sp.]|nr:MAG: dihydrofolate synthase/folylpolyglutamate synthase [Thiomicrorhabdus sp.]
MNIPNRQSSLEEWIDWLLQLHAKEVDLGLSRISQVAVAMQVEKPAPFVITVAGTNGKGSSVSMLVAILKAAGYKVGAYTSPHIQCFNERIQLNGCAVKDQLIVDAFSRIELARKETKLTYFEFSTLAALDIFKNAFLDVVVLEVGLGGRLDAVNLVDADAALITAIDIDHIDWLGDDRSVIATEKAGVTRPFKPAVCSDPQPPASLQQYADERSIPLCQLNRDFEYQQNGQQWSLSWREKFKGSTPPAQFTDLPIPGLKGAFQLQNAAGVIALLAVIADQIKVDYKAVCQGLITVSHPGRLESRKVNAQDWLIDVAHNPQSAQALADYLAAESLKCSDECSNQKYTAIFSVLSDKNSEPMVRALAPFIDRWLVADLHIDRSTSTDYLQQLLISSGVAQQDILLEDSIGSAVESAVRISSEKILVWGSFFTVAQVVDALDYVESRFKDSVDLKVGNPHG